MQVLYHSFKAGKLFRMTNASYRGPINAGQTKLNPSLKQGLFIGGGIASGCVILVILVICCFCSDRTPETDKVKIVKASKKPREVNKKLEVVPKASHNPIQNPQSNQGEAEGGEACIFEGETSIATQGKVIQFSYNDDSSKGNAMLNSGISVINSPQPSMPRLNVPAYAKIRRDGASAFYSKADSQ